MIAQDVLILQLFLYFSIILISSLISILIIKRFILWFIDIERISFGVSVFILLSFAYLEIYKISVLLGLPKLIYLLSYLSIPAVCILLSKYRSIIKIFYVTIFVAVLIPTFKIAFYNTKLLISDNYEELYSKVEKIDYENIEAKNLHNVYYFVPDL